ncbi:MAG: hypothetical protein ACYTAF_07480 [Planctomycetota bacterium]|jgi:ABC-type glycerol-3-phosphate transport system permease component
MASERRRKIVPVVIFLLHLTLHAWLGAAGWIRPFEIFNLLLLAANLVVTVLIRRGMGDLLEAAGIMIVIGSHALIGQHLAPDSLTSGTILMVNLLILYVGFRIIRELSTKHAAAFVGSYLVLFVIFIRWMTNAEALFLLSLLGLAATARNFRLLAYFWALVLSFTICQPYAWEAAIISFLTLKMVFSARGRMPSATATVSLACGLVLLLLVLLPVIVLMLRESPHSIANVLGDGRIRQAIWLTVVTATISTVVLAAFCVPLAYAISRLRFTGRTLLLSLIDIPIIIPQSVAGIALVMVFSKNQFLGETLFWTFGIRFDGTLLGICLAQIFVSMPFIMKASIAAFDAVPQGLEMAGRTLARTLRSPQQEEVRT